MRKKIRGGKTAKRIVNRKSSKGYIWNLNSCTCFVPFIEVLFQLFNDPSGVKRE